MNRGTARPTQGGGRLAALERSVGIGLALFSLVIAQARSILIGLALVGFSYWFVRGRRGAIVPVLSLLLVAGGAAWSVSTARSGSSEAVLTRTIGRRLDDHAAQIDRTIGELRDAIARAAAAGDRTLDDRLEPLRSAIVGYVNALRADERLALLAPDAALTAVADSRAAHQAAELALRPADDLAPYRAVVTSWRALGENVGRGATWAGVLDAMASSHPSSLANLTDQGFRDVGVGLAFGADALLYVTIAFVQRPGA